MNYINAEKVLPENLVNEIKKYVQSGYIYIPSEPEKKKRWGERSGNREYIRKRNNLIREKYRTGIKMDVLADEFFLSRESIKKIVYTKAS